MDAEVEQWRIKKLVQRLAEAQGNGTSMISLIIPANGQIARVQKMLTEEYGTASNIKSRVNRLSVLSAITSTQQRLKLYDRVPPNGLVIYCGTVLTPEGKERMVNIDFEPFKPINTSLYVCNNRFNTEPLSALFQTDATYGFIVVDGSGCLFASLTGNVPQILHSFTVDLPRKHNKGGQSSARFGRIRLEKRQNYLTKVAEMACQHFIAPDSNKPNVAGLILAGSAEFKSDLTDASVLDPRLQAILLSVVDVAYGGERGLNEAIDLSAATLANVKLVQEKQVLASFFDALAKDTGKYCFGATETLTALEMGAVDKLLVWENLGLQRYVLADKASGQEQVVVAKTAPDTDMEVVQTAPLVEYLVDNYKRFGATLVLLSDKSAEGHQFCQGFGGLAALLRYVVDLSAAQGVHSDADTDSDADLFDEL